MTSGILVLLALVSTAAPSAPPHTDAINLVLGDVSYTSRYHAPVPPGLDVDERIALHLRYVHDLLAARADATLTPWQRSARRRQLARLEAYLERRVFPRNDDHPDAMRPTFIDARGRICAVGYLIEQELGRPVAEWIAAHHKYAFVREIDTPLLDLWAFSVGLSRQELEWIQPDYPVPLSSGPIAGFTSLDRVDGQSKLDLALGLAADGEDGVPSRYELAGEYLLGGRRQQWNYQPQRWGLHLATALSNQEGRELGNLELGGFFVREREMGRLILRASALLPTASDDGEVELGDRLHGARLVDAVLLGPRSAGARLAVSRLWMEGMPDGLHGFLGMRLLILRVDAGVDVFSPLDAGGLHAAPRAGLGVGLETESVAWLIEGSTLWMPSSAAEEPAFQTNLAFALRMTEFFLQPAISLAYPRWDEETRWVLGLELQVIVGPHSHDNPYEWW